MNAMSPRDKELLQGMVNCYNTCHANFEETVRMVSSARGLMPEEVKTILERLRQTGGDDYDNFRRRLPADFPL